MDTFMDSEMENKSKNDVPAFYPFTRYNNHNFTNNPYIVADPDKRLKAVKEFDSLDSDVILATAIKTGTHWSHEILSMLLTRQTTEYNKAGTIRQYNFEARLDLENAKHLPKPRLFHTHMPIQYLPRKHLENGYKIVYLNRNPKDRLVSLYMYMIGKKGVPQWTWAEFFELFGIGNGDFYNGWFQYTKEWEDAKLSNSGNIFSLQYEWLLQDPFGTIKKLAQFLEVPYSDDFINKIIGKCAFNNLKSNKLDASRWLHPEGKSTIFRQGKIGDWKNWFTDAQNKTFDKIYQEEMAGYNIRFIYSGANDEDDNDIPYKHA